MISDRTDEGNDFGADRGLLTYWTSDQGPLYIKTNWQQVSADAFKAQLIAASDQFPTLLHANNENQSHVSLFVHGYNVGWTDAARRYEQFCTDLFSGQDSLGLCVCFDWPSYGSVVDYLPDRVRARECAADLPIQSATN